MSDVRGQTRFTSDARMFRMAPSPAITCFAASCLRVSHGLNKKHGEAGDSVFSLDAPRSKMARLLGSAHCQPVCPQRPGDFPRFRHAEGRAAFEFGGEGLTWDAGEFRKARDLYQLRKFRELLDGNRLR